MVKLTYLIVLSTPSYEHSIDYSSEELAICSRRVDDSDYVRLLSMDMAFEMLTSGRADLINQATSFLPPTKINTVNDNGFTALMLACINGDEAAVAALLDAGADLNVESPPPSNTPCKSPMINNIRQITVYKNNANISSSGNSVGHYNSISHNNCCAQNAINAETQHWTALTYTVLQGHCNIARMLLERGAAVEGGAKPSEDKCTITPLQAAAASGNGEMVALLLAHGAQPFLSTLIKDPFAFSGSVQRGCYR